MSVTYEIFTADYPEFADIPEGEGIPEGAVKRVLAQAVLMLSPSAWGKWHEMAIGLWSAHYLALEYDISGRCSELGMKNPYDAGTASSMSASTGGLSVSYAASSMRTGDDPTSADFARTGYGLRYLNLLHTVIAPGGVIRSADTSASERGAAVEYAS